jgi:tetratricopeptide (TPR) repeat protein
MPQCDPHAVFECGVPCRPRSAMTHTAESGFHRKGNWRDIVPALILIFLAISTQAFAVASDSPQSLLAAGQVDQAMQTLDRQIKTQPTAEAYNLLCRAYFDLGDWDAGIPYCERAVKLAPNNGLYHLWMGRIYGEKADHTNFLKAAGFAKKVPVQFELAVEFDPDNWQARTDLAGFVGGGEDKALAQAAILQTLKPATAHWVKARIAQKKKENAVAEQEYKASIQASNGGAREWVSLAGFYKRVGRLDDMEQVLNTVESRSLDQPAALADAANMLFTTERSTRLAIRLVRRYLATGPVEEWPAFKAHYLLGELLQRDGDLHGAIDQYHALPLWRRSSAPKANPAQDGNPLLH